MTDPQLRAPRSSRAPVPSSLMFVFAFSHYQNSQISGASHIGGRSAPASAITYMHSPASSRAIVWPRALPRRGLLPVSVLIGCALLAPPRVVEDFTVWGTFWSPLGVPSVPPPPAGAAEADLGVPSGGRSGVWSVGWAGDTQHAVSESGESKICGHPEGRRADVSPQ